MTFDIIKKIKIILVAVGFMVGSFGYCPRAHAGAWGEPITAQFLKEAMERAYDAFMSSMRASLKTMAADLLKGRLEALLLGTSSGQPLFITNYEDFIYLNPLEEAQVYMESYFEALQTGLSKETMKMFESVEVAINNEIFNVYGTASSTIDEYVDGGVDYLFDQVHGGGATAFSAALDNPMNNPFGAYLYSKKVALNQIAKGQDISRTQAIAGQGFVSRVDPDTNLIDLPGKLVGDLTSFVESLPQRIVAFATSIPEVIGTLAAQALTQTIQAGIYQVTEPIDNQLRAINSAYRDGVDEIQEQIYSGIKFTD